MIHNMQLVTEVAGFKTMKIKFDVITEVGKCTCRVDLTELDKDNRPKVSVKNYEVLGQPGDGNTSDKAIIEGMRRLSGSVADICNNNGWCLWSY